MEIRVPNQPTILVPGTQGHFDPVATIILSDGKGERHIEIRADCVIHTYVVDGKEVDTSGRIEHDDLLFIPSPDLEEED
jgi:hypothetical protein